MGKKIVENLTLKSNRSGILLWIFLGITFLYFLFPNSRIDFTPFNAHDSESYIALSSSIAHGRGYTRSFDSDIYVPHTTWPPGLPVLILPSIVAGGDQIDLHLMKINTILIALAGLWLAMLYVVRISDTKVFGMAVLLALAFNPFYWHYSRVVMTEVPSFVWAIGSLLLLDMTWGKKITY